MTTKKVWEIVKASYKNRCVICNKTEKVVGILEKAHIKAASKGGIEVLPMCPNCHAKYDANPCKLTDVQLKKIGMNRKDVVRLSPNNKKGKKGEWKKNGTALDLTTDHRRRSALRIL